MPSPLLTRYRSDEEIAARQHERVLIEATSLYTGLRAQIEALKSKADDKTVSALDEFLGALDDAHHDTLECSLKLAERAVADFDIDREAELVRQERSQLMFRQVGR